MKIASLNSDLNFNDDKVTIQVLMETDSSKEIRILFRKGQIMKEHQTGFPITVEIHRGAILFGAQGQEIKMSSGDLIYLEPNIPHDLKAEEDSIVRLTLSKFDQAERVKQVAN